METDTGGVSVKRFRKSKNRKMKSKEIELSEWRKFNEKIEQEAVTLTEWKETNSDSGKGMVKREKRVPKPAQPAERPRPAESRLNNSLKRDGAWETRKQYVLARKERMTAASREMEQYKKEYRVLAEYHNDITMLQELPADAKKRIQETATIVLRLQNDRKAFQDDSTRMDERKFQQMSQYTEDMPDVIKRLTSDEMYMTRLKTEIDHLEGEKGEQQYETKEAETNQGKMKKVSIICMFLLLGLFAAMIVMQLEFRLDVQVFLLLCGIAFAAVTLGVFIRFFNNLNRVKVAEHRLNKIISKQNKVKIKYVNAKNGVDFVYRKYQVHSASELLFQWEQFLVTKAAKENYQRSGDELIYYEDRLEQLLEQYRIQDPPIWMGQMECLADETKLKELKIEIESKIELARRQIEGCQKTKEKAKDEVSLLAIRHPEYADAIRELIEDGEEDIDD